MAFFKFRWPGQSEQAPAEKPAPAKRPRTPQAESIEVMRRRARHRLIGAAVLVLVGVIGFPMLFDTQPRPIPVDIPIEIPDRNKVAPLVVPGPMAQAPAAVAARPATTAEPAAALTARPAASTAAPARSAAVGNGLSEGEELVSSPRTAASKPAVAAATAAKPESKPEPARPEPKPAPEPRPAVRPDEAARARALLEGRTAEAARPSASKPEDGRFIVQVGAFADADKAREARTKVERSGMKTYTQVVDTKDGKRTRVRVGPFSDRAEADKAAARIRALDLSASVLTL